MKLFVSSRKSSLGQAWAAALILALVFPPPVYSADPPLPPAMVPAAEAQSPALHQINSYEQALAFAQDQVAQAKRAAESLPKGTTLTAEIVHIEGKEINPYYDWILKYLAFSGLKVKGIVPKREQFEQVARTVLESAPTEVLSAIQLNYGEPGVNEVVPSQSVWSKVKWNLRHFSDKIFGAPFGWIFRSAFIATSADGKRSWRFGPDPFLYRLGLSVASTGGVMWIAFTRFIVGYLNRSTPDLTLRQRFFDWSGFPSAAMGTLQSPSFYVLTGMVFCWIYVCMVFSREIDLVRGIGKKVVLDPKAVQGEQITVQRNDSAFLAACVAQEMFMNNAVFFTLAGFGVIRLSWSGFLQKNMTAVLQAGSYTGVEELRGGLLQEAERIRNSDPDKAETLRANADKIGNIFWKYPYPIALNLAMYLGLNLSGRARSIWLDIIPNIPLVLLGGAGLGFRSWHRRSEEQTAIKDSDVFGLTDEVSAMVGEGLTCEDLLVIRAVLPTPGVEN